jgi:hypothetical protein
MAKRKTKKEKDKEDVQPERSLDDIVGALLKVPPNNIRILKKRNKSIHSPASPDDKKR